MPLTDSQTDWAIAFGEEIKQKQSATNREMQSVSMHRDIEAEHMPLRWQEVLVAFQDHCTAYNDLIKPERPLALHRTGAHSFMIRPDALSEIVNGTYDYQTKRITIRTRKGTELYLPHVVLIGSGTAELFSYQRQRTITPTEIAQTTLELALR
jgi:hypothetical protein